LSAFENGCEVRSVSTERPDNGDDHD